MCNTTVASICIGNYSSDKLYCTKIQNRLKKKKEISSSKVYINSCISIKARYALKLDFPLLFCEWCFPFLEAFQGQWMTTLRLMLRGVDRLQLAMLLSGRRVFLLVAEGGLGFPCNPLRPALTMEAWLLTTNGGRGFLQ